ncbi:hypothetical protein [Ruegeria sp. A3M17]|uniref:hypothetical protein n=1 Tax=Ruegeria sp. A3M17 TaxID=2267229 RepID=UPI000DEAC1F0|nr:hypothetical protein [Ruegeria sp. A3M17]RBW60426.1 hypothetical protein DS906_06380 [Ruegeria sp. A3M17]
MNTPEWLKPGLYGAVIGAVLVSIAGFSWGGWVTGRTSNDRSVAMAREHVATALVPVCLDMARSDPERAAKMAAGWVTIPGTETPNRDIAQACLAALDVNKSPERPENTINEG